MFWYKDPDSGGMFTLWVLFLGSEINVNFNCHSRSFGRRPKRLLNSIWDKWYLVKPIPVPKISKSARGMNSTHYNLTDLHKWKDVWFVVVSVASSKLRTDMHSSDSCKCDWYDHLYVGNVLDVVSHLVSHLTYLPVAVLDINLKCCTLCSAGDLTGDMYRPPLAQNSFREVLTNTEITHRAFTAFVNVGDCRPEHYTIGADKKNRTVTCWIPSEAGKVMFF